VKADEAYIRESILQPAAKVVAGYQPVMPTFQGWLRKKASCNWWNTSNPGTRDGAHAGHEPIAARKR